MNFEHMKLCLCVQRPERPTCSLFAVTITVVHMRTKKPWGCCTCAQERGAGFRPMRMLYNCQHLLPLTVCVIYN